MTGYRCSHLRWRCHERGCYVASLPNWNWMHGCFPGAIHPTDVDGMVEMNRQFLFLEQKSPGAAFWEGGAGQSRALWRLAERPDTTVLCLRQDKTREDYLQTLIFKKGEEVRTEPLEKTQQWLRDWAVGTTAMKEAS